MSLSSRALIAALVVAVTTTGGALFVSGVAARAGQTRILADRSLALADRSFSFGGGELDLIDRAYDRVTGVYYKPVDSQRILSGVRREMQAGLREKKIAAPNVEKLATTGTRSGDIALVRAEVGTIVARYPKAASQSDAVRFAISGMLKSLDDPYSVYLSARDINSLNEQLSGGDFGGIGVYIAQDRDRRTLISPIDGNPAMAAGVRPGDIVLAVDGIATKGLALDKVERLIRGTVGTRVRLSLRSQKAAATRVITVTRGQVHVPSAVAKLDRGVEYVRLGDFGTTSYDEVRKAFLDGKARGAKGYVLDLRANGGGLLDAAVDISSLFIPDGAIVSTIDRNGAHDVRNANGTSIGTAPLVVLVDKYTASSAEITAGAIQDYHVGTLVGSKTFGKGVVQSIYKMPDQSALKITTARYVTPRGRDINKKGIDPDISIPDPTTQGLLDLRKFGTAQDLPYARARAIISSKGTSV